MLKIILLLFMFINADDLRIQEADALVVVKEVEVEMAEISWRKCKLLENHLLVEVNRMNKARKAFAAAEIDDKIYEYKNVKLDREMAEIFTRKSKK